VWVLQQGLGECQLFDTLRENQLFNTLFTFSAISIPRIAMLLTAIKNHFGRQPLQIMMEFEVLRI
jgi:hypothetical protein